MQLPELDREEYKDIPIFAMGYEGQPVNTPICICRYANITSMLHRHPIIQINYIVHGKLIHRINNISHTLVKGDIFVIPPYVPHQLSSLDGADFEVIELEFRPEFVFGRELDNYHTIEDGQSVFDFSYIEPFLVSECNVKPGINLSGKVQDEAETLLNSILKEYQTKKDSYLLAMKADLLKLLVIIGRAFREGLEVSPHKQFYDYHRDALTKALHYIDEHFNEPLTIEEISRLALLSQSYFSYLFKALTGQTFVEYLRNVRIKQAMEMLAKTNRRVVDICCDCGFNNVNHFNRTFKSVVGVTPTAYRLAHREEI